MVLMVGEHQDLWGIRAEAAWGTPRSSGTPHILMLSKEALVRRKTGELLTDIARSYNVSHSTISRLTS